MLALLSIPLLLMLLSRFRYPNSLTPLLVLVIFVVLYYFLPFSDCVIGILGVVLRDLPLHLLIMITQIATIVLHLSIYNLGTYASSK